MRCELGRLSALLVMVGIVAGCDGAKSHIVAAAPVDESGEDLREEATEAPEREAAEEGEEAIGTSASDDPTDGAQRDVLQVMKVGGFTGGSVRMTTNNAAPDGKKLGLIPVRATQGVTNCAFGGDDGKTLYITAWTSVWKLSGMPIAGLDWKVNRERLGCQ